MKQSFLIIGIVVLTLFVLILSGCGAQSQPEYLRLHIRANGNSPEEQSVKLAVRDAVVAYLTPLAAEVTDKAQMQALLANRLDAVCQIADGVLAQNGCAYRSTAYLATENFPTRSYGDLTLEEGLYDALIINLGTGEGANWWCVAFPPLCFVEGEATENDSVQYRSAIADWFARHTNND